MTDKERLTLLELGHKEVCITCEVLRVGIKLINENHLPTIEGKIKDLRFMLKLGFSLLGILITAGLTTIGILLLVV